MTPAQRLTAATKRLAELAGGELGDTIVMARYLLDLSWRARRGLPADDPALDVLAMKIDRWTDYFERERDRAERAL